MPSLKQFYQDMCDLFNDGKPLEWKWTRADGYWKMTKGFSNVQGKAVSVHLFAQYLIEERKMAEDYKKKRKGRKKKKIYVKYKKD